MNVLNTAADVVTRTAEAAVAGAGALSGAVVNGVVGGVQGTASGIKDGFGKGSHSVPAAALTMAAVGATGLVEWPVVLLVGGTALAVRQLHGQPSDGHQPEPGARADTGSAVRPPARRRPRTAATRKAKAPAGK
ncbi:hypothetical protein [Mycobacterium aquaticum]|uniref:Transmembrane protein n=1 Tax=Mycobacterium aquaticum TaxID=1927124 RepID=A0A1X0ACQ8_9MYCO|nr:hypothetical protein [Mycobacterium aquaticum]ORA27841.1 hypothetical protein BST13_29300 [Mycobacterium aquaticum]